MRRLCAIFSFFIGMLICTSAHSADARYSWYMRFIEDVPREAENNLRSLVEYLSAPMQNDYDKAQAYAYWIASHIVYDRYLYNKGSTTKLLKDYHGQTPEELLQTRVGICSDFANLFVAMCEIGNVKAGYISGYTFGKGESKSSRKDRANSAHAWNYFRYNGKKVYLDTTWMAKGKLDVDGRVSKFQRKRAMENIERDNKWRSVIYPIDPYYFDFSYRDEYSKQTVKRRERE